MLKTQTQKRKEKGRERRSRRSTGWVTVLLLILVGGAMVILNGFSVHPACTQNCQSQPAYFYNLPIPHSSYNGFYGTDNDGNQIHSDSHDNDGENSSGNHSSGSHSDENEDGGFHSGGEDEDP